MEVFLIRHTTPDVAHGVCYGQSDLDLVDGYPEEFEKVISQLPQSFDACYSSPLKRCFCLAQHIQDEVITDDRLKEYHFGEWELMLWEDIPKDALKGWKGDFVNQPAPGGESVSEMSERVMAFFQELSLKSYSRVAVVAHSVVIRIVLCHLRNLPLERAFEFKLEYGDVNQVEINVDSFK